MPSTTPFPQVVSFYTSPQYARDAFRLAHSVGRFAPSWPAPIVREQPPLGSWRANAWHKSSFLLSVWRDVPAPVPILWLDADAELVAPPPPLFVPPEADIAAVKGNVPRMRGGTILLTRSARVYSWLQAWRDHPDITTPGAHDDDRAQAAANEAGLTIHWLPRSFCTIVDRAGRTSESPDPVILQHQSSRTRRDL